MNSTNTKISLPYKNPDNDPHGPYILTSSITSSSNPIKDYEWNGHIPPKGYSWRFSKETAIKLEQKNKVIFSKNELPKIKRYLSETRNNLRNLTSSISSTSFKYELDFALSTIPELAKTLNYNENETFYSYGENNLTADVVFAKSRDSKPWIVIEIKNPQGKLDNTRAIEQLKRYLDEFDCRTGIVLTPRTLTILSNSIITTYTLSEITELQIDEVISILEREAQPQPPKQTTPREPLLVQLIELVEKAKTNEEKGRSLEQLAHNLIEKTPSLKTKYRNLQTRSSEIDLIIEYDNSKGRIPLYEELGRYCLVECKNWSTPVGVSPVRDFIGKLDKCKVKLGIIFSKNGITGVDSGADALREIQSRYDRDGLFLLVFSLEDIKKINNGGSFLELLDRKADNLRFDSQGY